MTRPVLLVTGAGGFIGSCIAETLALSGCATVRAGIRQHASASRIAGLPLEIVRCDLMDPASLDAALQGVDVVVHCARGKGNDNSVTTDGTQLLLDRIKAAGVRQLIFTSSIAVYGAVRGLVHEDTPAVEPISAYGAGKRVAEAACREAASTALRIAVLRPTLVYGPFSDLWSVPYLNRFASGRWRALGPKGEGKCNLVYVGDLARFVQFLVETDLGPYAVFNANGPEVPTWNSYLERFNAALGNRPLRPPNTRFGLQVAVRRRVRRVGTYIMTHHRDLIDSASNTPLRPIIRKMEEEIRLFPSRDELQLFISDVTYSMAAAAKAGFVPQTTVDQGIALTVDWARRQGLAA